MLVQAEHAVARLCSVLHHHNRAIRAHAQLVQLMSVKKPPLHQPTLPKLLGPVVVAQGRLCLTRPLQSKTWSR